MAPGRAPSRTTILTLMLYGSRVISIAENLAT